MTWAEICQDKNLQNLPYKVELNRRGKIVISPTRNKHGFYQGEIAYLLRKMLPHGHVLVECAIDTMEGTYVADAAWVSAQRFKVIEEELSCSIAPEICVEVWSRSNSEEEIEMKRRLYFDKGSLEFWHCDETGHLTFFSTRGKIEFSQLCPEFPQRIQP